MKEVRLRSLSRKLYNQSVREYVGEVWILLHSGEAREANGAAKLAGSVRATAHFCRTTLYGMYTKTANNLLAQIKELRVIADIQFQLSPKHVRK